MLKNIILVSQIIISALLIFFIVIQSKGTGISGSIMGGSPVYSTKRGIEKTVFYATIIFSCLFFVSSLILLIIK